MYPKRVTPYAGEIHHAGFRLTSDPGCVDTNQLHVARREGRPAQLTGAPRGVSNPLRWSASRRCARDAPLHRWLHVALPGQTSGPASCRPRGQILALSRDSQEFQPIASTPAQDPRIPIFRHKIPPSALCGMSKLAQPVRHSHDSGRAAAPARSPGHVRPRVEIVWAQRELQGLTQRTP